MKLFKWNIPDPQGSRSQIVLLILVCTAMVLGVFNKPVAVAQVATSITPTNGAGSLGTAVSEPVGNTYNITGGTRPSGGTNLFHSFGEFSVGAADTANFLNTPINGSLPLTTNILGRVTDGNPSNIFGTIQTTDFGNANLFLMNPAGIVFGPNATLNVAGSVHFTTADYLKLADGAVFNAVPNLAADGLLTSAPVAAFGFLGSNPAAITVQGSQLTVAEGKAISLVGGDITIQSGTLADSSIQPAHLMAPGGQINIASVASPGEILYPSLAPAANVNGQSFSGMGNITLSEGSTLEVSANAAGTVKIRGGQLVMDQAVISADSVDADGAAVGIDIQVTDNVSITHVDAPALTARTTGAGNAGEIKINSGSMDVTSVFNEAFFFFSAIDTHTSGTGNAGNVTINTGNLTVNGDLAFGIGWFIDTGTSGPSPGRGGNVSITANTIDFQTATINTGNLPAFFLDEGGAGTAGNVTIAADQVNMSFSQIVTDSNDFVTPVGTSGDLTITAKDLNLFGTGFSTTGRERSGSITIAANNLVATETQIQAITNLAQGGTIQITGDAIEFRNGSNIASSTMGDGDAGPIIITATDHVAFLESGAVGRPSGIFNNSFGENGGLGAAGDVVITTPHLELTGGSRINTTTTTSGRGGNVIITANSISMSGENDGFESEPLFNLGTTQSSGIYTRTIGGNCIGPCGNAGDISITTGTLSMSAGSQINSGTTSSGNGGTILINASDTISMSGTLSTGQSGGIQSRSIGTDPDAGSGGDITLTAGQSVTLLDGAAVSASSTGPADAGNISINAGRKLTMTDSSITTEAAEAAGGNINIQAIEQVTLDNSTISTSVLGGAGGGGNITIDPVVISLQNNSSILAQAVFGNGGNILLNTNLLLVDPTSIISASSEFGQSGTIQSPTSNLAGTVGSLPSSLNKQQALQAQRCAVLAEQGSSSFVIAGRETLPAEPGGWLTSPYAARQTATGQRAQGTGVEDESYGREARSQREESPTFGTEDGFTVSLRHLTPAGFLTQRFAEDESAGCRS